MVRVTVAVIDYRSVSIKMYSLKLQEGWQTDEVEDWLYNNTDFNSDCYYMCSENGIPVNYL